MTPEERADMRQQVRQLLPKPPARSTEDMLAEAIVKAMERPRAEVTVYTTADRDGALAEAGRLRARAQRLEDLVSPEGRHGLE